MNSNSNIHWLLLHFLYSCAWNVVLVHVQIKKYMLKYFFEHIYHFPWRNRVLYYADRKCLSLDLCSAKLFFHYSIFVSESLSKLSVSPTKLLLKIKCRGEIKTDFMTGALFLLLFEKNIFFAILIWLHIYAEGETLLYKWLDLNLSAKGIVPHSY